MYLLKERVYNQNYAVCYHRTERSDLVNILKTSGFKVSGENGTMYGAGWYMTYEERSQRNDHMASTFGPYIIKSRVSLNGFVIFDEEIAKEVYGKDYDLPDQVRIITGIDDASTNMTEKLIYKQAGNTDSEKEAKVIAKSLKALQASKQKWIIKFKDYSSFQYNPLSSFSYQKLKMPYSDSIPSYEFTVKCGDKTFYFESPRVESISMLVPKKYSPDVVDFEFLNNAGIITGDYSAGAAKSFYDDNRSNGWYKKIKGLMYTGRLDGNCVVVYDVNNVRPLAVEIPDRLHYASDDDYREFKREFESMFTDDELKSLFTLAYPSYLGTGIAFSYENAGMGEVMAKVYDLFPRTSLQRMHDFLKNRHGWKDKYEMRGHMENAIQLYFNLLKNPEFVERDHTFIYDTSTEDGRDNLKFFGEYQSSINNFMKKEYLKSNMIKGTWEPVEKETLKYFVQNGLKQVGES